MSDYILTYVWCPYCHEMHSVSFYPNGDNYRNYPFYDCVGHGTFTEQQSLEDQKKFC